MFQDTVLPLGAVAT